MHVFDEDTRRDALVLACWRDGRERFCPVVSVDGSDGLLLDISGCEHLFGGEIAMAVAVGWVAVARFYGPRRTGRHGWSCLGGGPICQDAERRGGYPSGQERRALAVMPVAAPRFDPAIVEGLAEVAIERIGQVFDLPRSTLPALYGDELLHRIDQALGTLPEPIARLREHVAFTAFANCREAPRKSKR